jgi:hypothetical protein
LNEKEKERGDRKGEESAQCEDCVLQGLPLVILFQPSASLSEKDSMRLQEEGQNLADSLPSPFIEVSFFSFTFSLLLLLQDLERQPVVLLKV